MVDSGMDLNNPGPFRSVLELAVAMAETVRQFADSWGRPFVDVASELGAGASNALTSREPRFHTDWINVHAAAVGKLERSLAITMSAQLLSAEAVVREASATMIRFGWSRTDLQHLVSSSTGQGPAAQALAEGSALAELDELEWMTRRESPEAHTFRSEPVDPQDG